MKAVKNVIPMPGKGAGKGGKKTVQCRQDEVEAVPFGSGDWKVSDVPGLILRAGARSKTWRLQRRIQGKLVTRVLGEMSAAEARRLAMKEWAKLKPKPAGGIPTLEEAWRRYCEDKDLRPTTKQGYLQMLGYMPEYWRKRDLRAIGEDRLGMRSLFESMKRNRGPMLAAYTFRTLRAVYNWWRRVMIDLPENPVSVVDIPPTPSRDWAMDEEALRRWWAKVQNMRPARKTVYLVMLLTGCRVGSALGMRWEDVDFARGIVRFSTSKTKPYSVPMSGWLERWLREYQKDAVPSEWVFPSPYKPGEPMASQIKEPGLPGPHALRHTARTALAQLGCPIETAKTLLGHALSGSVSEKYVTAAMLVEPARPWAEKMAERYAQILGWEN